MAQFVHEKTIGASGGPYAYLVPVSTLTSAEIGGKMYLYAGSAASGGLTAFALEKGQDAAYLGQRGPASAYGTYGVADLDTIRIGNATYLITSGGSDNQMSLHKLTGAGGFSTPYNLGSSGGRPGAVTDTEVITVAGATYLFAVEYATDGITGLRLTGAGGSSVTGTTPDGSTTYLADIAATASAAIGNKSFAFFASATENGVSSMRITPNNGQLMDTARLGTEDGLWISTPSTMIDVQAGGNTYLVLGAAGSDSLSVLKVAGWGGLSVTDHLLDSLDTRFQNVTALDATKINHRVLITAGGADDGISLLELSPSGLLMHLGTIADSTVTTLQNVSAIETVAVDEELQIYVASEVEAGITQFTVDLGSFGVLRRGSTDGEWLNGIWADDLIDGFEGDDVLKGNNGADRLIDGPGKDLMFGGNGADTFTFTADGELDIVKDFNKNQDILDFSQMEMLYGLNQLELIDKPYGVYIRYRGEGFRIEPQWGTLDSDDLTADMFVF